MLIRTNAVAIKTATGASETAANRPTVRAARSSSARGAGGSSGSGAAAGSAFVGSDSMEPTSKKVAGSTPR